MNTVIVPVDFSETSFNAARYAAQLLTGHYGVTMILHHVYEKQGKAAEATSNLENLKEELLKTGIVKITVLAEEGTDFITELEKLARHQQADLIIMGITERSVIGQTFMASNILEIVKKKVCPVLIVPPDARFHEIKNVLLTSDFRNVQNATPSVPIKKILKTFKPSLHVINVDSEHYVALTEAYQKEKAVLQEMFADFNPEFYFLGLYDVGEAIHQFAGDKNIDLIITIPKDHSLLSKLFIKSHTKKLAYHSTVPVLAVHE
jgi:nucleotide-binding universal stress UspA family protein